MSVKGCLFPRPSSAWPAAPVSKRTRAAIATRLQVAHPCLENFLRALIDLPLQSCFACSPVTPAIDISHSWVSKSAYIAGGIAGLVKSSEIDEFVSARV